MDCPCCYKIIPAKDCITGVKIDKDRYFYLQDNYGNSFIFPIEVKRNLKILKSIEDWFQFTVSQINPQFICKLGIKDDKLALLYLYKDVYTIKRKDKIAIKRKHISKSFNYILLI